MRRIHEGALCGSFLMGKHWPCGPALSRERLKGMQFGRFLRRTNPFLEIAQRHEYPYQLHRGYHKRHRTPVDQQTSGDAKADQHHRRA